MGKRAIKSLDFREGEARLWKDEDDGALSVSVDDPWDGFMDAKDVERLGKFLISAAKSMKTAGGGEHGK